jgi:hypothetical protein
LKLRTGAVWMVALLAASLLAACGGSEEDASTAAVRLVNATQEFGAIDLYASDTLQLSAVAEGSASDYVGLDAGDYTLKLKRSASSSTADTITLSATGDTDYTVVAYNDGSTLSTAVFSDDKSAPTSGYASLRIYNAGSSAGSVDVYITETDADFASATATFSVNATYVSSYDEIAAGTYRVRVTGAGDKSDLRLDIPSIALADQQIAMLVLTPTSGGVLVNGMLVNQAGSVSAYDNANARVRIVAAIGGNASVTASTADGELATTLQSPSAGAYTIVPAAMTGFAVQVDGTAIDTSAFAVAPGEDVTLLVYGDAAAPQWRALLDDNAPATSSSYTKLRLVHVLNGLGSTLSLSADYVSVADNIVYGTASEAASLAGGTAIRLEATSPLFAQPLYLAPEVSLTAKSAYSLFMMGDAAAPIAVLRKDR